MRPTESNPETLASAAPHRPEVALPVCAEVLQGVSTGALALGWGALLLPLAPLLHWIGKGILYADRTEWLALLAWEPLWRSLQVGGVTVCIALGLGTPCAWLLARATWRGRPVLLALLLIQAATPLYVTTTAWVHLWGLGPLSATHPGWRALWCGIVQGWQWTPLAAGLLAAAFAAVPRELEDVARLDGGAIAVWRRVTLPLSAGAIVAAAMLVWTLAAGEITVVDAVWLRTHTEALYLAFHQRLDPAPAALAGLPLWAGSTLSLAATAYFMRHLFTETGGSEHHLRARQRPLTRPQMALAWGGTLLLAATACYPLCSLAQTAWIGAAPAPNARPALPDPALPWRWDTLGPFWSSALLASAAALLALALAWPVAVWLRNSTHRWQRVAAGALLLTLFAMPSPLVGMALLATWNSAFWNDLATQTGLAPLSTMPQLIADSPAILLLLYATRTAPLAVAVLWARLGRIPRALSEAAALEGATPWQIRRHALLPQCRRTLAILGTCIFILHLNELAGAVLVTPPGVPLFAIRFATLIHAGVYPDLARLAFQPLLLIFPLAILGAWTLQRSTR